MAKTMIKIERVKTLEKVWYIRTHPGLKRVNNYIYLK